MPERVAPAKRNGGSQQPDWVLSEAGIFTFRLKKPKKMGLCLLALMGLAAFVTVLTGVMA